MLKELKDLAQKKSKAEKVVQEYNKKKEEEKIRKSVRADKLEVYFEPVTKAVEKITPSTTQFGQLVPVPNIMDLPVPPEPLAIEDPDEPEDPDDPDEPEDPDDPDEPQAGPSSGPQVVEIETPGINFSKFDAEEQLDNTAAGADLTNEQKIDLAKSMNNPGRYFHKI